MPINTVESGLQILLLITLWEVRGRVLVPVALLERVRLVVGQLVKRNRRRSWESKEVVMEVEGQEGLVKGKRF
jgi:hypothetical protein